MKLTIYTCLVLLCSISLWSVPAAAQMPFEDCCVENCEDLGGGTISCNNLSLAACLEQIFPVTAASRLANEGNRSCKGAVMEHDGGPSLCGANEIECTNGESSWCCEDGTGCVGGCGPFFGTCTLSCGSG